MEWPRGELRVELAADEERVILQLHDLGESRAGIDAGDLHLRSHIEVLVFVIELVTMTVPFLDEIGAVALIGQAPGGQLAIVLP